MERVDADALELVLEAVLAHLERLELVLVHVRPPEQPRVQHVREVLAAGHLHAAPPTMHIQLHMQFHVHVHVNAAYHRSSFTSAGE